MGSRRMRTYWKATKLGLSSWHERAGRDLERESLSCSDFVLNAAPVLPKNTQGKEGTHPVLGEHRTRGFLHLVLNVT